MPIPQAFKPELLRQLNELPEEAWADNVWRQTLYKELEAGRCTEDEVSAFERESVAAVRYAVRGVFDGIPSRFDDKRVKRRGRRSSSEKRTRSTRIVGIRYVRRHALDPFISQLVSSGARTTLLYLIARCGKQRVFKKQTCLVASDLGIAQRTVQAHYAALEKAGYIVRGAVDPKTGATPIRLTEAIEPPRFKCASAPITCSRGTATQESAPTKPIKEESKTICAKAVDTGEPAPESRSAGQLTARKPGAELSPPAQPRALAPGVEDMLDRAFRQDREAQRHSNQPGDAGPTEFDRHLSAILVRVACSHSERQAERRSSRHGTSISTDMGSAGSREGQGRGSSEKVSSRTRPDESAGRPRSAA
ncbi:hypothetical protein mvi_52170 [Methylobacterium indicum]|uniref:Uncharacterized protein n=1 Tax=Methylobacterium indicum TaxID=1775910 RepID=A0A8H8WY61_9HYPH|nr:hypothetical protein mvi_52170 [Methylobacterium indicum]